MANSGETKITATTMSPETDAELATAIPEAKEAHERPLSSGSSKDSGDVDLEKQQTPTDDMPPAEPVKSEAESVYPGTKQTAIVMLSICLVIFLVALV